MQTYFKMMHSTPARVIRLFGGLWFVIAGAELSAGFAIALALVGTATAVTGIADICPVELVVNAARPKSFGPHQRVA